MGCGYRADCEHSMTATVHSRTHGALSTDPCAVVDAYFSDDKVESGFLVVVVAAQQHRALRYAGVIANGDFSQVVNPNAFTNPSMVADF